MPDMGPITPDEVQWVKKNSIPNEVIQIFNDLIATNWDGRRAVVLQKLAVAAIKQHLNCTSEEIFKNHWLDVEETFRTAGWKVEFDQPAYCESYEPSFTFSRDKK